MLKWSEEFSIKNQHLDEQHKKFMQKIAKSLELCNSTSPSKSQQLEQLIQETISEAQEHFKDEETYMQRIKYPLLDKHILLHKEFLSKSSMLMVDVGDAEHCAQAFYNHLQHWLLQHILIQDKHIESHRNRLYDIKEIPYSLEQQTKILAESVDISKEKTHIYICFCYLRESEVYDSLHKILEKEGTFIRCKACKQPLVYRDPDLDDEKTFEALAKKHFKQF